MINDLLEKKKYYILLFDFYEKLLTIKQQEYFRNYYFLDLSLSEIANENQVSRNAIFDSLSKICSLLDNYEDKLKLAFKHKKMLKIIEKYEMEDNEEIKKILSELKNIE